MKHTGEQFTGNTEITSHQRLNTELAWMNSTTNTHITYRKNDKGKRLALLREKVSMAASSSWSQTELLSRPGKISQEEQQEGREAARARRG